MEAAAAMQWRWVEVVWLEREAEGGEVAIAARRARVRCM